LLEQVAVHYHSPLADVIRRFLLGNFRVGSPTSSARLHDRFLKQATGRGGGHQGKRVLPSGGLSEKSDISGIAAQDRDVLLHPLKRGNLVPQTEVGLAVVRLESQLAEPVVEGNQ